MILQNRPLVITLLTWAIAQLLKTIIDALANKTVDWTRLVGDGGMPSCHSATVCSLATIIGIIYGVTSPYFAITAIFGIIIMNDAMGVRREAGKHAAILNELIPLISLDQPPEENLKVLLGHTPLQVLAGGTLGIISAFILNMII